jgi:aspartyl-tRNA(Asn)/glutamyl-tRNA(Gln) amidotransferase subunit B
VTNAEAIRLGIMAGLALGCDIAPESTFHRKNYFYPDLPKAYQISQFDEPLCIGGSFTYLQEEGPQVVGITRVHLEEDAAKLQHLSASGRRAGAEQSAVDFNRGGTPLAEIVTEPDIRTAQQAADFLKQLRGTLREIGISDCNMEEGSMRADANVSIRPVGSTELGTKTELKNMNSFTFLRRGVEAEIARQIAIARLPLLPGTGPGSGGARSRVGGGASRRDAGGTGRAPRPLRSDGADLRGRRGAHRVA